MLRYVAIQHGMRKHSVMVCVCVMATDEVESNLQKHCGPKWCILFGERCFMYNRKQSYNFPHWNMNFLIMGAWTATKKVKKKQAEKSSVSFIFYRVQKYWIICFQQRIRSKDSFSLLPLSRSLCVCGFHSFPTAPNNKQQPNATFTFANVLELASYSCFIWLRCEWFSVTFSL